MTRLSVRLVADPTHILRETSDYAAISSELRRIDAHFDRWATQVGLNAAADADAVLAAYAKPVAYLCKARGYRTTDVVRAPQSAPEAAAMRAKFLAEHTHSEDEARFFVDGVGCFYLRDDDQILALSCTAGDLLLIAAGTRHWFDMGLNPRFTAIRFFNRPEGWIAHFTGDPVADRFPPFVAAAAS